MAEAGKRKEPIIPKKNWEQLRRTIDANLQANETVDEGIEEASKIRELIKENVQRGPKELYKYSTSSASAEYIRPNALMGILASLVGDSDESGRIYYIIRKNAGLDENSLYKEQNFTATATNALVGLLAAVNGDMEEARRIYAVIKEKMAKGENQLYGYGYYEHGADRYTRAEYTGVNSAVGALAAVVGDEKEAKRIYGILKEKISKGENGLYWDYEGAGLIQESEHVSTNAMMGILAAGVGDLSEARELRRIIEEKMPKAPNGMYLTDSTARAGPFTEISASVGILMAVSGGQKIKIPKAGTEAEDLSGSNKKKANEVPRIPKKNWDDLKRGLILEEAKRGDNT
jgi:hypothetical protein